MSQKRNRSINWDEEEKQLFRIFLKDYAHIIENKCLDTNTNKNKTKAWEEFHKKFNELNSRPRELSQLKIQWKSMKINARKVCSTFKKEVNKIGGGARPAKLLRNYNIYDSDGMVMGEVKTNTENQQLANMSIEAIEDVDTQVAFEEFTPSAVSQDNKSAVTPMEKYVNSLPIKISEDDITMVTPKTKSIGINPAKKVPKRKIILNNIVGNGSKSRKDQEEYVSRMLSHSKLLKDEEHMRRMEMADEEHKIKMEIHKEKLKAAILERKIHEEKLKTAMLEREILELRKAREAS